MKNILIIAKKEWLNYFTNPTGYIFGGLLLLVVNFLFFQDFFIINQASLAPLWGILALLMALFIPAISMNTIAEEKKSGSWEILLSLPISETEVIGGKFLGGLGFIGLTLLLLLPTMITVLVLGRPDLGIIFGGLVGTILLAAAYLAVGIFASSISNQPVVGFLVALIILLINNFMGQEMLLARLPLAFKEVVAYLSIGWHANLFGQGLIKLSDLVFFGSWIFIFLLLAVLSLKARDR